MSGTVIIDYDAGNIRSVCNALERLGADYALSADPQVIARAQRLILPGVGNAAAAMASLRERGLTELIRSCRRPVLGICVGMQLMCRSSEEGPVQGLGIFDTDVRRFSPDSGDKVPHMGWNTVANLDSRLFKGLQDGEYMYFVHSYYAGCCCDTIATTRHAGVMLSAALRYENFYGTQFHPEKSGDAGSKVLENFLKL